MPASTLDPVNAALRTSLTKNPSENSLDIQLASSTKKALLSKIEFETAGTYQSTVLDKLKSKYISLGKNTTPQASKPENTGADETLTLAKHELYPLEAVQLGWNNSDWTVGIGMINMGNTCYLNSTLQALFHIPALVNWLVSDRQHMAECKDSGGICINCAMRRTLHESQQRNVDGIRPYLIYNKLRQLCKNLIPGRQEDAHEFLRCLVDAMERAYLSRFRNHTEFDTRTKETTPLNQILGGYLRSAVRCLECGHVSTTFQHFQDLLLDIRKAQTINEALESYFSREKLDDESYHCESCQKKVQATKQFSLERAPMVLCIQLKRFSVSNSKLTKHVQFRQRLELTRFARQRPSVPLVYRLVSLVTHMGPTVNCGHYTAVAQGPCGNFYQFDDGMVRPISHQAVFSTNAYIMFYELECSPYAKANGTNSTKVKVMTAPVEQEKKDNIPAVKLQLNGSTSSKYYGPELPPEFVKHQTQNGTTLNSNNVNGKKHKLSSSSSSDGENEQPAEKKPHPTTANTSTVLTINSTEQKAQPNITQENRLAICNTSNGVALDMPTITSTTQITKLVPYDDESSSSEDSVSSPNETNSRVSTKAAVGEWKVTSTTDSNGQVMPSDSKTWNKKKVLNERSTVNELLKMSHSGYSAPVTSWNGTRAQLDKEVTNERREDRKRALADNADQGRVKHIKLNANGNFKSNPGYNPIQEYHNAKNWSQNNGSQPYRPFFNGNNRHRNNRRNFHHKGYHKGYRFRP